MISGNLLRNEMGATLRPLGYRKDGRLWVKESGGIYWAVALDRSSIVNAYAVEIGLVILSEIDGGPPKRLVDMHQRIFAEKLPIDGIDPVVLQRALDLERAPMEDGVRLSVFRSALEVIAAWIGCIQSVSDLRKHYESGEFEASGVRISFRRIIA